MESCSRKAHYKYIKQSFQVSLFLNAFHVEGVIKYVLEKAKVQKSSSCSSYICGPDAFMLEIRKMLTSVEIGIPNENVHQESFDF